MKKNLLLMVVCCPAMLAAQNGVTVSNLAVDAGTVTFNVSWDKNTMPVELWSDTVWVFVDYNDAGVMKRLPVTDASVSAGTVTKIPNNDKGVWVEGNARTNSSFSATVQLLTAVKDVGGACVYGSNYPPVGKYTSVQNIAFTGTPEYDITIKKDVDGTTELRQSGSPFTVPASYTVESFTDKTGAPGIILGGPQPQGSCTYTEPAVMGTFANFNPENVGAATYVSLVDERDNKFYPVLKMGDRWMMARNLNYQTGLYFNDRSDQAHGNSFTVTTAGAGSYAIGSFWCPGGDGGSTAQTSSTYSCEVYGALYTWETAMMVDGKWSNDTRNNTAWDSDPPASTSTGVGNTNNGCRGAGNTNGHGICPANWHVPTDAEWGDILNAMETGAATIHNTGTGWRGSVAGTKSKSKCMCSSESCNNDENVSWSNGTVGTDVYGLRVLPSGRRTNDGSNFANRGYYAYFWSSSAYHGTSAWARQFLYSRAPVNRGYNTRSFGFSVRCIRD